MIVCVCVPFLAHAQSEGRKAPPAAAAPVVQAKRDTVIRWNEDSLIAARTMSADTVMRPKKSATVAMLASMVLPGAGQIYNESYWKAPVVWGFGAYFYYVYRDQNKQYQSFRDAYAAIVDSTSTNDQQAYKTFLLGQRKFYFSQRNTFGWYLAITYLITIVDAYVDASLFNFEVSPDLQPHGEWKATLHIRLR
jgi:hypothetical protein